MQNTKAPNIITSGCESFSYRFLLPVNIQMIEEALASLGEYGEVRLIVEKGRLRFLVTQRSYDMLKLRPGALVKELDISPE